jgi:peptide/nickel transport system ATP-binding protein
VAGRTASTIWTTRCKIRGREIGAIFQDPLTSLNRCSIGAQLTETDPAASRHQQADAKIRAISLKDVGIPSPEERPNRYPHRFSSGMRQRVVIAPALQLRRS